MEFYAQRSGHSPDLAYVVGVMLGDGSCWKMPSSWRVELQCKDEEFASAFAVSLSRVVKRPEKRRPHVGRTSDDRMFRVCVASKSFGEWWMPKWDDVTLLRPIVHRNPAPFLRGLYDSEGNLTNVVRVFSGRSETLLLAIEALEAMGMTGTIRCFRPAGSDVVLPKTGPSKSKTDLWFLVPKPTDQFLREVGSNIPRKASWSTFTNCAWCGVRFPVRSKRHDRPSPCCSPQCAARKREARKREVMP